MGIAVELICNAVRAPYVVCLYALQLVALCGTVCLIGSVAPAQESSIRGFAPEASRVADERWSHQRTTFTVLVLNDQLRVSQLAILKGSHSSRLSTTEPKNNPRAEYINALSGHPSGLESTFATGPEQAFLVQAEVLSPRSLVSGLEAKYATWESSLEDLRPRTSVSGEFVYALTQVNYRAWHLPIVLDMPPLRGSDERR
jgi:hypothetical protein